MRFFSKLLSIFSKCQAPTACRIQIVSQTIVSSANFAVLFHSRGLVQSLLLISNQYFTAYNLTYFKAIATISSLSVCLFPRLKLTFLRSAWVIFNKRFLPITFVKRSFMFRLVVSLWFVFLFAFLWEAHVCLCVLLIEATWAFV